MSRENSENGVDRQLDRFDYHLLSAVDAFQELTGDTQLRPFLEAARDRMVTGLDEATPGANRYRGELARLRQEEIQKAIAEIKPPQQKSRKVVIRSRVNREPPPSQTPLSIELYLYPQTRQLQLPDRSLEKLSPIEFAVLAKLGSEGFLEGLPFRRFLPYSEIAQAAPLRKSNSPPADLLKTHVFHLRSVFGGEPYIETLRGIGYRLAATCNLIMQNPKIS